MVRRDDRAVVDPPEPDELDLDGGDLAEAEPPKESALKDVVRLVLLVPAVAVGGVLFVVVAGLVAAGFVLMGLAFAPDDSGQEEFAATVVRQGRCVESDDELIEAVVTGDGISELEADADLDEADDDGQTVLYCAAAHGAAEDAETLLAAGASPDLEAAGGTPLVAAVAQGNAEVVEVLLQAGASVDGGEPQAALARALERTDTTLVQRLLDAGASATESVPLEQPNVAGGRLTRVGEEELAPPESATDPLVAVLLLSGELALPPMHAAALGDDPETVGLLASRGADVNQAVYAGVTPLHAAVIANSPDAVVALLAAGADPNAEPDPITGSPFTLATSLGRTQIVELLVAG